MIEASIMSSTPTTLTSSGTRMPLSSSCAGYAGHPFGFEGEILTNGFSDPCRAVLYSMIHWSKSAGRAFTD
jgi:hypothetical protein